MAEERVAPATLPRWLYRGLGALAGVYLVSIFLGSSGSRLPDELLPRPLRYFTQIACLFPRARPMGIEYRVQAYSCRSGQFRELDYRPYFPIRADDKESRFERAGFFHRRDRKVMEALDDYLVGRHNAGAKAGTARDGIEGAIGGILFMSLRLPLPEPGSRIERYRRRPLEDYPHDQRKYWYKTPQSRLRERCAEAAR